MVGAGVIGLASAFQLARAGASVTLFDPQPAGGATHAAAGMLAPSAEVAPGERDNYEIQRGAMAAWQKLSDELDQVGAGPVALHRVGTLLVGWDASDRRALSQFLGVADEFGVAHRHVTRAEEPEIFRGLSDRVSDGEVMVDDGWLEPDQATSTLRRGLDAVGVRLEETLIDAVGEADGAVFARAGEREWRGERGLLATGALPPPQGLPRSAHQIRPVRGITTQVEGLDRAGLPMVRALVRGRHFYLVGRDGGRCVMGASAEERRDAVVEVGELSRQLRDALEIVPALEGARVVETRVGLRPASEDGRPFFEPLGRHWAWSAGHYRHGVTLAPWAAQRALDWMRA